MMAFVLYEQTPYSGLRLVRRLYQSKEISGDHYRLPFENPRVAYQQIDVNSDALLLELVNAYSITSWQDAIFGMIESQHPAIHFGQMQELPKEIIVPND
jgi:hypothetical protein